MIAELFSDTSGFKPVDLEKISKATFGDLALLQSINR
jgi:hypothetical protein